MDWADKIAHKILDDPENFVKDPVAGPIAMHFNAFYGVLAQMLRDEREGCALLVDREAGIAHDDWNDRNMARELSKIAEMIRERDGAVVIADHPHPGA